MRRCFLIGLAFSCVALAAASPATADPNCTCRYAGQNYALGEYACIRGRLARCEMVLNNTAWTFISEGCPQVERRRAPPAVIPVQAGIHDGEAVIVALAYAPATRD
jgi:hypothetical protein